MHVARARWPSSNGKTYESIYLRESFRQDGKVKKRDIANLSHCDPAEIAAIELALKHKGDLAVLASLDSVQLQEGASVGAVCVVAAIARRLGLNQALGSDFAGQLALWQVIARLLDQGSRLSAVRLAQVHAACDVLSIRRGFDENDLYENLTWLCLHQEQIERRLFAARHSQRKPELFLYDVTSSYLEGDDNALGAYGYNRDGKKGKKQIVIGLLCDQEGTPVSTEVFRGNTQDPKTFGAQVRKASQRFGCERVTFVGDRGMIKSGQIEELSQAGFHYITAITKPQIDTLLSGGVLQMALFDDSLCEVAQEGLRYVLRRNPVRAAEMAATRTGKQISVEALVQQRNQYLAKHAKAKVDAAEKKILTKIAQLKATAWLRVESAGRSLKLVADEAARTEAARLDGCYVIKTDLPETAASKQVVHDRYKDLTDVEMAFRISKTAHLEMRPIYVRTEEHTRGHVLVVMLAYLIRRELSKAWAALNVTVEEGLAQLTTLCSMEVKVEGGASCLRIPVPRQESSALLTAASVRMPEVLPHLETRVVTRRSLPSRRKVPVSPTA
ncbi:MAG: IS1634 family transposase [Candidatus Korobacteraceae bacterium]